MLFVTCINLSSHAGNYSPTFSPSVPNQNLLSVSGCLVFQESHCCSYSRCSYTPYLGFDWDQDSTRGSPCCSPFFKTGRGDWTGFLLLKTRKYALYASLLNCMWLTLTLLSLSSRWAGQLLRWVRCAPVLFLDGSWLGFIEAFEGECWSCISVELNSSRLVFSLNSGNVESFIQSTETQLHLVLHLCILSVLVWAIFSKAIGALDHPSMHPDQPMLGLVVGEEQNRVVSQLQVQIQNHKLRYQIDRGSPDSVMRLRWQRC